jgi:hypothetical protein
MFKAVGSTCRPCVPSQQKPAAGVATASAEWHPWAQLEGTGAMLSVSLQTEFCFPTVNIKITIQVANIYSLSS